jgi:hypothetical protein
MQPFVAYPSLRSGRPAARRIGRQVSSAGRKSSESTTSEEGLGSILRDQSNAKMRRFFSGVASLFSELRSRSWRESKHQMPSGCAPHIDLQAVSAVYPAYDSPLPDVPVLALGLVPEMELAAFDEVDASDGRRPSLCAPTTKIGTNAAGVKTGYPANSSIMHLLRLSFGPTGSRRHLRREPVRHVSIASWTEHVHLPPPSRDSSAELWSVGVGSSGQIGGQGGYLETCACCCLICGGCCCPPWPGRAGDSSRGHHTALHLCELGGRRLRHQCDGHRDGKREHRGRTE